MGLIEQQASLNQPLDRLFFFSTCSFGMLRQLFLTQVGICAFSIFLVLNYFIFELSPLTLVWISIVHEVGSLDIAY